MSGEGFVPMSASQDSRPVHFSAVVDSAAPRQGCGGPVLQKGGGYERPAFQSTASTPRGGGCERPPDSPDFHPPGRPKRRVNPGPQTSLPTPSENRPPPT